jgi:hypothetical protein
MKVNKAKWTRIASVIGCSRRIALALEAPAFTLRVP